MFCPSSLTNRSIGLNLEFLNSLELDIQNIAKVDCSTSLSSSGFILHVKEPHVQMQTSQPPSTISTSLSASLCPSRHILAIYIPCPTRNSLREQRREQTQTDSARRWETVLGREFLHSQSMFWERGGIIYLFGHEVGCGKGTIPSKSCCWRKGTSFA